PYVAGRRIHRHESTLQILCGPADLRNLGDPRRNRRFGLTLKFRVEGRIHAKTVAENAICAEERKERPPDFCLEVPARIARTRGRGGLGFARTPGGHQSRTRLML